MSKNLFCEICSLQFGKKIVYDIHMSFVHKKEESKSRKIGALIKETNEDLGQHINSEISENYKKLNSLNKELTEGSINCFICGKKFSTKYGLKDHIEAIHEGKNHTNAQYVITALLKRIT